MIKTRKDQTWMKRGAIWPAPVMLAVIMVGIAIFAREGASAGAKQSSGPNHPAGARHPLVSAFLASGARPTTTDLNSWSHVNHEFATSEQLRSLAGRIAAGFGLNPPALKAESIQEKSFRQFQLAATLADQARIVILAQSVAPLSDGRKKLPAETYVVVRIIKEGLMEDLASAEDHLRQNLAVVGRDPQVFTCIHGVLPGRQSAAGRRSLLAGILNSVSARLLTEISERNLQSITAYSPRIPGKLRVGKEDTNLNVALRYDEIGNVTYLAVGSPLIPDEY